MARYINCELACTEIDKGDLLVGNNAEWAKEIIYRTPAADVNEVVHGAWEKASEFMPIYRCSICKERNLFKDGNNVFSNYCPNCGAKMDGGKHG